MEQNLTPENSTKQVKQGPIEPEKPRFSISSIVEKDGRWKVLGFTIEAWLIAFLVALALPYINIVALPVMFFVFAGAIAIYTVWALFKLV